MVIGECVCRTIGERQQAVGSGLPIAIGIQWWEGKRQKAKGKGCDAAEFRLYARYSQFTHNTLYQPYQRYQPAPFYQLLTC
ncbi:hypothetical protein A4D02_09000 [Niastella koreensis]|uniref:Uncharacterized protein n=2 Tax=Niastella koreensis TaxID=354356 RepID=G8TQC9_NIAKG|nr:hypothetical protein Niako_5913 [Niastella koreensis GR20-10]OQP48828.1 hypothetical protein A4D02_09000 [Niastella koreensis]